ncbi:uncharacterized protein LOC125944253 [Dermacentor silvarum]|uniref:uncharacterized protein LOC125944253 n=1 Tax=Dermacentor silvarum TaxID=543639 RepID=UPI002101369B|nr:uncharacterized protein LOC125944253 [Dermacentor silvarum]
MASGREIVFPISSSGRSTADTLTPSAYERDLESYTPEDTTVTNSRERFVVLTMSVLLLLISGALFAILLTLLSDDLSLISTAISKHTPDFLLPSFPVITNSLPVNGAFTRIECSIILRYVVTRTTAGARDEHLQCSRCRLLKGFSRCVQYRDNDHTGSTYREVLLTDANTQPLFAEYDSQSSLIRVRGPDCTQPQNK